MTSTFIPDVFVTRADYDAWVSLGKPTTGPGALPAGARPINPTDLNRLGVSVALLSQQTQAPPPAAGIIHEQTTPAAAWQVDHALGRLPAVEVYVAGQRVLTDVHATSTTVLITWAAATTGVAILT